MQAARQADALEQMARMINADLATLGSDAHFKWAGGELGVFLPRSFKQERRTLATIRTTGFDTQPDGDRVPAGLAALGATPEQWRRWVQIIEEEKRAHLCADCPMAQPCCFCFPFGPLQCCVCLLGNPFVWWDLAKVSKARERATNAINEELLPLGAHFTYASESEELAYFRPGMPKPKPKLSVLSRTIAIAGGGTYMLPTPMGAMGSRGAPDGNSGRDEELGRAKV